MSQPTPSDTTSATVPSQPVKAPSPLKLDSKLIFFAISRQCCLFIVVLRIIRLAQQQHGLRHGDYQRYR